MEVTRTGHHAKHPCAERLPLPLSPRCTGGASRAVLRGRGRVETAQKKKRRCSGNGSEQDN
jgi:hypothetical protein